MIGELLSATDIPQPRVRTSKNTLENFNKDRIVSSLIKETNIDEASAKMIAREVELDISKLHVKYLTAPLIREMVNVKLLEHGFESARMRYTRLGMPVYDTRQLIYEGMAVKNLQHNPETVHKWMADVVAREYALVNVLPPTRADQHMNAELHIHNLNYFATRPFCFTHDLRFFLKNGLKVDGTGNFTSITGPAKNTHVAFLHASKVLSASQINCAGGQGLFAFNTFLAPYVKGFDYDKAKQAAQIFIYEMSQMFVARGGQGVFSSIDLNLEMPKKLSELKAVTPGGVLSGTYANYSEEAKLLLKAILKIYIEGDYIGKPFNFPKINLWLEPNYAEDENLKLAMELSAKSGSINYIMRQENMKELSTYQHSNYFFDMTSSTKEFDTLNGSVRGGVLQVVTLNMPKIAYDSGKEDKKFEETLRARMEAAKDILLLKREIIHKNLESNLLPFLNQPINGDKYLIPDKQTYVIGFLGINEMCKYYIGKGLHENDSFEFAKYALDIMRTCTKEFRGQTGLNFSIAGVDSESTSQRFAEIDARNYPSAIVNQDAITGKVSYTGSFHTEKNADIPAYKKAEIEGELQNISNSGLSIFREKDISANSLLKLTRKVSSLKLRYLTYTKV